MKSSDIIHPQAPKKCLLQWSSWANRKKKNATRGSKRNPWPINESGSEKNDTLFPTMSGLRRGSPSFVRKIDLPQQVLLLLYHASKVAEFFFVGHDPAHGSGQNA